MKTQRRTLARFTIVVIALLAPHTLAAHHSFAMYDKSITYVFTGVVERIVPDGAHMQIVFVPLNDARDALVRDAGGMPATWLVEMGGSAQGAREGITTESFARGTVFSVGLSPLRSGQRGGARTEGLFKCPSEETAGPRQALRLGRGRHVAWRGSPRESNRCVEAMTRTKYRVAVVSFLVCMCAVMWSFTKASGQAREATQKSVGRGWPIAIPLAKYHGYPADEFVGAVTPWYYEASATAKGGKPPANVQPLAHDIFTSKDFYVDRALWMDKRYYRCNSPIALDSIWGDYASGPGAIENNDAATAAWGHCERDYPREAIVSPYPFKTAQEHYEALLAETKARGGPTVHSKDSLPDWNGRYTRNLNLVFGRGRRGGGPGQPLPQEFAEPPQWVVGWSNQMPTILSLLTPEYQQRFVQAVYHKVNSNAAQNSLMYCRPEGLLRWWSGPGGPSQLDVMVVPGRVQFLGGTDNALRHVQVGREFTLKGAVPNLGADVRSWLGETIGFWDRDTLITWTSNVQGWFTHGSWEYSSKMQLIEIWTPRTLADGRFAGLEHETVFYDPEAFVQPVRDIRFFSRRGDLKEAPPFHLEHCNQTIFIGKDGRATQVPPGTTIDYKVRDLYDRPWARIWEEYFEKGMQRPKAADDLGGFK